MLPRLWLLVGSDRPTKGQTMSVIELSWTAKKEFLSILRGVRFLLTQWDVQVNSILHCVIYSVRQHLFQKIKDVAVSVTHTRKLADQSSWENYGHGWIILCRIFRRKERHWHTHRDRYQKVIVQEIHTFGSCKYKGSISILSLHREHRLYLTPCWQSTIDPIRGLKRSLPSELRDKQGPTSQSPAQDHGSTLIQNLL